MTNIANPLHAALLPYTEGTGVQFLAAEDALDDIPVVSGCDVSGITPASLDFVVAGPEVFAGTEPHLLLRAWGTWLKEGGRVAVLLPAGGPSIDVYLRFLASEAGLAVENPQGLDAGWWLITGVRSTCHAIRRDIQKLGLEITHPDGDQGSAGWKSELFYGYGSLLLQAGEGALAEQAFRATLEVDESDPDVLVGLALACGMQGRLSDMNRILEDTTDAYPEHNLAGQWLTKCRERIAALSTEQQGGEDVLAPNASPAGVSGEEATAQQDALAR